MQHDRIALRRVGYRNGFEQCAGIGMRSLAKQPVSRCDFDHFSEVHDAHSVCQLLDNSQVVCNEQECDAQFLPQVQDQFDDPRLDGYIQGRDGFVGNDQFRFWKQRPCQCHALSLTAGQLMRKTLQYIRLQPDRFQRPADTGMTLSGDIDPEVVQRLNQAV